MILSISPSSVSVWSYAYSGTRRRIVREIKVDLTGSLPTEDIEVFPRVRLDFPLPGQVAELWEGPARLIVSRGQSAGHSIIWDDISLRLNTSLISQLLEHVAGKIIVEIIDKKTANVLATADSSLTLLPFNNFMWQYEYYDSLAAFVLPSDSFVSDVLTRTRELLKHRTGESSTEGYQSGPERVRIIANAIFDALQSFNYSYSNPPAGLLGVGQRIRTPSQIKSQSAATCLDSTVLMAACFEEVGIHSVLFLIPGHAFCGYLTDDRVRGYIENEVAQGGVIRGSENRQALSKLLLGGYIQPVETTTTTDGSASTFEDSCLKQNNFNVSANIQAIESLVVTSLAWQSGITPPVLLGEQQIQGDFRKPPRNAEEVKVKFEELTAAEIIDIDSNDKEIPPRIRQWKASLLDLSARNPLLKVKKKVIKLDFPPNLLGFLDDALFSPKNRIELLSFDRVPLEWIESGVTEKEYESWVASDMKLLSPSFRDLPQVLRSVEAITKDAIKQGVAGAEALLYRDKYNFVLDRYRRDHAKAVARMTSEAKENMLRSGVNTVYLALGSISWSEDSAGIRGQRKQTNWHAPLYLYPIVIDGGSGSPFTVRLDPQGEVTPNYCLHEKLKRLGIDVPELISPLEDEKGLDFDKMFGSIASRLKNEKKTNFAVNPDVFVGVFDFATFRLWMDLNDHWKEMAKVSPVAKHLMLTPNQEFTHQGEEARPILKPLTPIASDDSQRDAIELALNGESFRLEGPPGTGKSQTITNLLASCLAYNKKVLFVAEKQTALDAVKKRLDACGLGDFCLNLHAKGDSDTRLRKNITEAINTALDKEINPQESKWDDLTFAINAEQRVLDGYRDALHSSEVGETLWKINEDLLDVGAGETISLSYKFVEDFFNQWPKFRSLMEQVSDALDNVGKPSECRWRWVSGVRVGSDSFDQLSSCLKNIYESYQRGINIQKELIELIDRIDPEQMITVMNFLELRVQGWMPSFDEIRNLSYGKVTSYHDALSNGSSEERNVASIVNELRQISERLELSNQILNPELLGSESIEQAAEIKDATDKLFESIEVRQLIAEWENIRKELLELGRYGILEILERTDLSVVHTAVSSLNDSTFSDKLHGFQIECERLASDVSDHSLNIDPLFLTRNDFVNLRVLIKDIEDANLLNRGKRTRALRDSLADQARANDDRLLLLSLKVMLDLGKRSQDLSLRVRASFSSAVPADFKPWDLKSFKQFSEALVMARNHDIKMRLGIKNLELNGEDLERGLRESLTLATKIQDLNTPKLALSLGVVLTAFRPWVAGEGARLRQAVLVAQTQKIRTVLGEYALTTDDEALLDALNQFLDIRPKLAELMMRIQKDLLPGTSAVIRAWKHSDLELLVKAAATAGAMRDLVRDPENLHFLSVLDGIEDARPAVESLKSISNTWIELHKILEIDEVAFKNWRGTSLVQAVLGQFPTLIRDGGPHHSFIELNRWITLQKSLKNLRDLDLSTVVERIIENDMQPDELIRVVRRSALRENFRSMLQTKNLDRFDRRVHEKRIATFEAALKEAQKLLKVRIPGLINQRQRTRVTVTGRSAGATQSLLRGLKPGRGERTPIRDLISKYGKALSDSLPCFLMSPESISRLLPVGAVDFDLVIFDEASQVRVSHAIGAIGRARACVVVGDSKQMPPSNTFGSNKGVYIQDDDNDDNDDVIDPEENSELVSDFESEGDSSANLLTEWQSAEDMESILAEFAESGFAARQLLCHYRSRDEVLIAFSNKNMYDKPMLTFPSVYGNDSLALRWIHVPNGNFERSSKAENYKFESGEIKALRTNRAEAEMLVEEVVSRLRDQDRRKKWLEDKSGESETIIVVTFNIQQMKLVEALLQNEAPDLVAEAVSEGEPDELTGARRLPRLKVRNLENVQGDEADTVIFSVAFTKASNGKIPLNWGPVTQPKGDRRLNVAVTRAKKEMLVFCSFEPDDLVAGRNREDLSREVELVYKFLKLAKDGPERIENLGIEVTGSQHVNTIASALRERGYRVQTQVGLSRLRVDLAVSRPECIDSWELAIFIDDTAWSERGTAFQRDILPRQVLPGLGWRRVMRIWLPAWINEKDAILQDIDSLFSQLASGLPEESALEIDEAFLKDINKENISSGGRQIDDVKANQVPFRPFLPVVLGTSKWFTDSEKSRSAKERLVGLIQKVIDAESPIEISRLGKFVCNSLDMSRVTPERIAQVRKLVPASQRKKDVVGEFCWSKSHDSSEWNSFRTSLDEGDRERKIEEICVREIGNALVETISRVHSINESDALREIAGIFGFKAVSEKVTSALTTVLHALSKEGRIVLVNDEYHLPK